MSLEKRVKKFNQQSLLEQTAMILRQEEQKGFGQKKYVMTWALIKVIELAVMYARPSARKKATERHVKRLYNVVCENSNFVREDNEADSFFKAQVIMKTLHAQQFWFYKNVYGGQLARQYHTCQNAGANSEIHKVLQQHFGLSPYEIFKVLLLIWSSCQHQSSTYFNIHKLAIFKHEEQARSVLNGIAIDCRKYQDRLLNRTFRNDSFDYYDYSVSKNSPIIAVGDQFLIYSINAFSDFVRNFLFRVLGPTWIDSRKSLSQHQDHLEAYVESLLGEAGVETQNEDQLKLSYPDSKKVVDFLIEESDKRFTLVEMKSGVFNPRIKVYPTKELYFQRIKSSIIDAFEQAYTLVNAIKQKTDVADANLLVVTQEDFFFTHMTDLWEHFLEDYYSSKGKVDWFDFDALPLQNILIVSADEFEYLLFCVKGEQASLDEILKRIIALQGKERKAFVRMYLDEFNLKQGELPSTQRLVEEIKAELQQSLQSSL